jgi:hypothetical protein
MTRLNSYRLEPIKAEVQRHADDAAATQDRIKLEERFFAPACGSPTLTMGGSSPVN